MMNVVKGMDQAMKAMDLEKVSLYFSASRESILGRFTPESLSVDDESEHCGVELRRRVAAYLTQPRTNLLADTN